MGLSVALRGIAAVAALYLTVIYQVIERITRPPGPPWNWRR